MPPRRELIAEPTTLEMICQFNKLKPLKFSGWTDPLAYEEWLRRTENLFEVMDCPESSKVTWQPTNFKRRLNSGGVRLNPKLGNRL